MSNPSSNAAPWLIVDIRIRRLLGKKTCDVVVTCRDRELVISCPDHACAVRWAELERKSYRLAPVHLK